MEKEYILQTNDVVKLKRVVRLGILMVLCFVFSLTGGAKEQIDRPLSLEESVNIALEDNRRIRRAEIRTEKAKAKKRERLGYFLPKVSTGFSCTRLDESTPLTISGLAPISLGDADQYDGSINLRQSLFTGGRLSAEYVKASSRLDRSRFSFRQVKDDLAFEVKRAYFTVLEAEKFQKVGQEQTVRLNAHLESVKNLYAAGSVPKTNLLSSAVELARAKQRLIRAESNLKLAYASFNKVLGRGLGENVSLEQVNDYTSLFKEKFLKEYIAEAIKNRMELAIFQTDLNISDKNIQIAQSRYLPTINLDASLNRKKGYLGSVGRWDNSWEVNLKVNLDLWDWGIRRNKLVGTTLDKEELNQELELLEDEIRLEVMEAYFNLGAAEEMLEVADAVVSSAKENFRVAETRFKEGMSTNTDVLDAQTLLTQAQTDYFQALYSCHISRAALDRMAGGPGKPGAM